jgi:hypothetical protein
VGAEARPDRVPADVLARVAEVLLGVDHPRGVPIPEEVSPAAVAGVEPLRVHAVQALHPERQLRDGRLDDEVVVVRHQAERVEPPAEPLGALGEQAEEGDPVEVVAEDRGLVDAVGRDVEDPVGELHTQDARHPCDGSRVG